VLPFRFTLQSGIPIHEQVAFAAKKAMMSGKLRPGDPFPSVRAISRALKIHVNTAQRVVAELTQEGLLEVRPGIGTVVCQPSQPPRAARLKLLAPDVDQVAVEAMKLGISLVDLSRFLEERWRKLQPDPLESGGEDPRS
jgi:GntR family transcriptional regulator